MSENNDIALTKTERQAIKEVLRCKGTMEEGENRVWIFRTNDASPGCQSSLERIGKKLGPHGRHFLKKRIVTSTPEVKKTLENSGLHD